MNPVKLYLLDSGFSSLGINFSENKGKLLENIVAIELYRQEKDYFYYKGKQECDFIIMSSTKPATAVQVCWELNTKNTKRELGALVEVMGELKIEDHFVLTFDQEEEVEFKSHKFKLIPVWKWLLSQETHAKVQIPSPHREE